MRKTISLLVISTLILCRLSAQQRVDTATLVKELDEVMAFSVQPYLHYTGIVAMQAGPMLDTVKSGSVLHCECYKLGDRLYYGSEQEELFLQDSLLVRISHARQTIQLGKVDMASVKRMDVLPLKRKDMQALLREQCILSRLPDKGDTGQIRVSTHEKLAPGGVSYSELLVVYLRSSHLPLRMEVSMHVLGDAGEQTMGALKAGGFDVAKMVSVKDGQRVLDMTRTLAMTFGEIDNTKTQAGQMPLWKDRVTYDDDTKKYSGAGRCEGYEVIKTF